MLVRDIKQAAKSVLGYCEDATLYDRLTDAIEVLSNKGQWDSLQAYMDITVSSDNVVTLPNEVESPIKININGNPSFSRSKLYEFSLNGPGNDMQDTAGYSWMDKGEIPVIRQPVSPSLITVTDVTASDNGKTITLFGRDAANLPIQDTLTLNNVTPAVTANTYATITRVVKDVTLGYVVLSDAVSTILASYAPEETQPTYRQIRLSKPAAAIRMLFRRKTYVISSDNDFIPLQNRMAILLMLKALEFFRNGGAEDLQKGAALEAQSLKFLQEEQTSRNNFDLVTNTEISPALDLNYNNSDSIIVADIYDEAAAIFGNIGREGIFDKITDSIELLANKGQWDGLVGDVDIVTDDYYYVTLPRYVEAPIAININGTPKRMRNKWFQYHLNGPGSESSSCRAWDYIGDVVTLRPLPTAMQFIAKPDMSADNDKVITIYGYDENNRWIRTQVGGVWQDGFQVVNDSAATLPPNDAQKCIRIERITRDATIGFVQLIGYDSSRAVSVPVGFYYPDETEPSYVRIRLPVRAQWIRMRYRKRSLKIGSLTDPIHLKNKLALSAAMRSVKAIMDSKFDDAERFESKAMQYLSEEQASRNPGETFDFQMIDNNHSWIII